VQDTEAQIASNKVHNFQAARTSAGTARTGRGSAEHKHIRHGWPPRLCIGLRKHLQCALNKARISLLKLDPRLCAPMNHRRTRSRCIPRPAHRADADGRGGHERPPRGPRAPPPLPSPLTATAPAGRARRRRPRPPDPARLARRVAGPGRGGSGGGVGGPGLRGHHGRPAAAGASAAGGGGGAHAAGLPPVAAHHRPARLKPVGAPGSRPARAGPHASLVLFKPASTHSPPLRVTTPAVAGGARRRRRRRTAGRVVCVTMGRYARAGCQQLGQGG
jgi:hypothetical protein